MTFNALDHDMKGYFLEFFEPEYYTPNKIKEAGRDLLNLVCLIPPLRENATQKLIRLRRIYHLTTKYPAYTSDYEKNVSRGIDPKRIPLLLDALCSGCDLRCDPTSTWIIFTDETEKDVKEIVSLMPKSLESTQGDIESRYSITPLDAACFNVEVPLKVIEFLLEKGANPELGYKHHGIIQLTFLKDWEWLIDQKKLRDDLQTRFREIKVIFEKHKLAITQGQTQKKIKL